MNKVHVTPTLPNIEIKNNHDNHFLTKTITIVLIIINVIFVVAGFFSNRPNIQTRLHEACLWETGHYRKVNCDDVGQSKCVPIKDIYPNNKKNPFTYIIEDNPQEYSDQPIEWALGDVSICICLDGYNVHKGTCQPALTKWYDPKILANLLCSILLLLPKKTNPYCHLVISILLLIWGICLTQLLQNQYSNY